MTPDEADELTALCAASWPVPAWTDDQAALWHDNLLDLDAQPAWDAFTSLRDHEDRRPMWAKFREAYHAQVRRGQMEFSSHRGLPSGGASSLKPMIARLRDIHTATADQHDHRKGTQGCPVCKLHDYDRIGKHLPSCARCRTIGQALAAEPHEVVTKDPTKIGDES